MRFKPWFISDLPAELEVTAWLEGDKSTVMGISHKTRPYHGVQFHPEVRNINLALIQWGQVDFLS